MPGTAKFCFQPKVVDLGETYECIASNCLQWYTFCTLSHSRLFTAAEDLDSINPAFSFAGHMKDCRGMSQAEVRSLIVRGTKCFDKKSKAYALVKALHRGIGVHHSGLPLKYRQHVEILFRCGFLRVVFATGNYNAASNSHTIQICQSVLLA